jgi:hypothetical protein
MAERYGHCRVWSLTEMGRAGAGPSSTPVVAELPEVREERPIAVRAQLATAGIAVAEQSGSMAATLDQDGFISNHMNEAIACRS